MSHNGGFQTSTPEHPYDRVFMHDAEVSIDRPVTPPRARVVLLGASNLTRGISTVVATAGRVIRRAPIDFFSALGHGRSYGIQSTVLGRSLPGIIECGIWDALEGHAGQHQSLPTYALITDVGNDIMYGRSPAEIAEWIDTCISRLRAIEARIVMTAPPMESIRSISAARYCAARTILFPTNRMTYDHAMQQVRELDARIRDLATRHDLPLVEPSGEWFGLDPIHIRMRHWRESWAEILDPWRNGEVDGAGRGDDLREHTAEIDPVGESFVRWLRLRLARPARMRFLGFRVCKRQPATELSDGSRMWLY